MEYAAYQMVSENTGSLNTGSYLTRGDYSALVKDFVTDIWFGFSPNDVVELGVYDREQNQVGWQTIKQDKEYNVNKYTYLNTREETITYTYAELQPDFILYKNDKILVSPPVDLSQSFGIQLGSYVLTYNFTREMAGTPIAPLVIKEISPSRKELKLQPVGGSTLQYEAFCRKKILLSDVSPLYIQYAQDCPYGQIYTTISSLYVPEINTLKSLFYLNTDGAVITFLKNLYEDYVLYTNTPKDADGNVIGDPERLLRIQGIRTYFTNYLRSNVNSITDFSSIDRNFEVFVSASIERKFAPIGKNIAQEYVKAKAFVYDFFTKYFYKSITQLLSSTYTEKYFSSLRNALNTGNGKLYTIVNHDVLDERIESTDPLTLLVKLQSEAPSDLAIGTNVWVSNISLTPYVVDSIFKTSGVGALVSIGPPNFSATIPEISVGHVNKSYTAADLRQEDTTNRELTVSRKQAELVADYSNFSNFVVFSSAEVRLKIFKNKMMQMASLTSSLQTLENKNEAFLLASGSIYPFYTKEYDTLQGELEAIVSGFDGYEAYLYRSGNYNYINGTFVSASYVVEMDASASAYDQTNRDSLVNNTPQHILTNEDNDEYIVFLSMIGHYFDEIYSYISNLPAEKSIGQGSTETFTRTIIDHMLETFGWKLDDTLEQANMVNNFLTSENGGVDSMSAEDRVKAIRNRILLNLPKIYKTKGTEAAVKLLLSCYGIPSTLLNIREYGGVDQHNDGATYTQYEKIFMRQFDTSSASDFLTGNFGEHNRTLEYKFSIPGSEPYQYNKKYYQWGVVYGGAAASANTGLGGMRGGFTKERGKNLGRVFFTVGLYGAEDLIIYSDPIPIFDGNVYSVMIRKNDPDPYYQDASSIDDVPTKYDLYVQRNDNGRAVVRSTSSYINYNSASNYRFSNGGYLMIGGWFSAHNQQGYTGTFDKWMQWLDPITDSNFEDHVNNPCSYAFSGSRDGYKSLVFRQHVDYPFDMKFLPPGSSAGYILSSSRWMGTWQNSSNYYADSSSASRLYIEGGGDSSVTTTPTYLWVNWNPWSGSQTLVYDPVTCQNVSQSCYPYQFKEVNYPVTYAISKYGPNRFRNEKIKYVSQSVEARFDINRRSTYVNRNQIVPDSNMVGFFADPQDFKNKDILRYLGNFDLMGMIGSPENTFSSSYDQLRVLRKKYAKVQNYMPSGSNPRFGEMMTLYHLYFNRSVFEAIRNLTPARSNVLTGVVIEPTILERPKYQSKPIGSELNTGNAFYADITASRYFRETNTKLVRMTQSIEFAEFNIDTSLLTGSYFNTGSLPKNRYIDLDVAYINSPNFIYPYNYLPQGTYVCDLPDRYQFSHFGADGGSSVPIDMLVDTHPTGSQKFRLMKQWDTYTIASKNGEWVRTDRAADNLYATNSIQLYKYILVSDDWYQSVVYTTDTENGNALPDPGFHFAETFKNTPNQIKNNLRADPVNLGMGGWAMGSLIYSVGNGSHLEIVKGYPRNHYTHKRQIFSPFRGSKHGTVAGTVTTSSYVRSRQTIDTTIGADGLENGTLPVQSFDVSNVNLVKSDNVINQ